MTRWMILLALTIAAGHFEFLRAQELRPDYFLDSLPSVEQVIVNNLDRFATKEYYRRKETLWAFQQHGYAEVLAAEIQGDGLAAIVAYLKMHLQQEYSLNHAPITTVSATHQIIVLPLDWRMPADPWRREK